MREQRWIYAKTYPRYPHEYCRKQDQCPGLFERVVQTIWSEGFNRRYLGRIWRSLDVGEHYVWLYPLLEPGMAAPLERAGIINHARRDQPRLVDMQGW